MLNLYLTPEAIAVLVQPILAGCLVLYFLSLPEKTRATWLLIAMFATATVYMINNLLMYTVVGSSQFYFQDLLHFSALPGVFLLVAFAYAFLGNVHPRESKLFLWGSGALIAGALIVLLVRLLLYGAEATEPGLFYEMMGLGVIIWALGVFLRKARLPGKAGRAHRAMAGVFVFILVAQFTSILMLFDLISLRLHYFIADLSFLLLFAGFAFVYLNYAPHPTSFQVKLVGMSLFTVLTVLSIVSVAAFPEEALIQESSIRLPGQTSLRFEPEEEGYLVTSVPFAYDPVPGKRLTLEADTKTVSLPGFTFHFFGKPQQQLSIHREATVTFDDRLVLEASSMTDRFSELPQIALLGIPLRETEAGGIYLKRAPDRLTITWRNLTQPDHSNRNTVQLVLFVDGSFVFNYAQIDALIVGGRRGVFPGGPSTALHTAEGPLLAQPSGPMLVEDFTSTYRRRVHHRMLPVAYGLFGATAFILLVFPLFFRISLVQPLSRLLGGVRRVNAGDLDAKVPVGVRDEIGRLTEHFNQMTGSLQQAHHELKDYAEHLEEMVDERTEQLAVQADRLRELDVAKSRFFANISHELRTPLTLIVGPLERLFNEQNGSLDAASQEQLGMMLRNGQRLQRLINQILDLTKLEAGALHLDFRTYDLVAFVRRHLRLYEGLAQYQNVTLTFEAPVASCVVSFDAEQMEKVLANFLSNAIKFTDAGGQVSVVVRRQDDRAEIAITDTGVGISAEKLPFIFDRFYQAENSSTRSFEGTGIGLALVKELVGLHGGTIHAESEPGRGSTFTIQLPTGPVAPQADPDEAVGDGQAEAVALEGSSFLVTDLAPQPVPPSSSDVDQTTVLIVEDNADMRAFVRSILEPTYRVLEAADGEAGLHLAQTALPDLILADVMMPKMDGLSMSRALHADPTTGSIPLVMLTARAALDDRVEGLETGADAYLIKPFNEQVLLLQVGNLIAQQQRLRERLRQTPTPKASQVSMPSPPSAFEAQVCEVIEAHLSDPQFSVEALADAVALSRQQLYRRLREDTGTTPVAYIRQFRLEQAARLLGERQGNVSEVAYAVGFNSLSYFTRCFHEHFEETPSAFVQREVG